MRSRRLLAALLLLLVLPATARAHPGHSPTPTLPRPTQTVGAASPAGVLQSFARAVERADLAAMEGLWLADAAVFENAGANWGWADYRDHHLKPELAVMTGIRYQLEDVREHVEGDRAWATFRFRFQAQMGERAVDGEGLGTALFVKQGGRWRIRHLHTSSRPHH